MKFEFFSKCYQCLCPSGGQREPLLPKNSSESDENEIGQIRKAVIVGNFKSGLSDMRHRLLGQKRNYKSGLGIDFNLLILGKKQIVIFQHQIYESETISSFLRVCVKEANLIVVCISSDELMKGNTKSVDYIMRKVREYELIRDVSFNFMFVSTRCELVSHDEWGDLLTKLQQLAEKHKVNPLSCLFHSAQYNHNIIVLQRMFVRSCYPEIGIEASFLGPPESLKDACARVIIRHEMPYLSNDSISSEVKDAISAAQKNISAPRLG